MSGFVLDNSVTMAWCFPEEATPRTESLLKRASAYETLHVPVLWEYEVINVLMLAVLRGRLLQERADIFIHDLQRFDIRRDIPDRERVFADLQATVRKHRLTAYDAAYLELATRLQLPLATLDKDLIKAAQATGIDLL